MVDMTKDAVFLPGKIHGCEDEIYIVYLNPDANEGKGSFEVCVCNYETLLEVYEDAKHDAERFNEIMPDYFHGKWWYIDAPSEMYNEYVQSFEDADFIVGRDGDEEDEFNFIIRWAQKRQREENELLSDYKKRVEMWDRIDLLTEKYIEALLGMSTEPVILQGDDLLALGKEITEKVVEHLEKEVGAKFPELNESF